MTDPDKIHKIPFDQIRPGNNDRTQFDPVGIRELAKNILANGLIQPITVRLIAPDPSVVFDGDRYGDLAQYEIVAGERRFRALRLLEVEEIPSIVKELTDDEASAIMLSENVSRSDLDPVDEANAYSYRISAMGWTVKECAERAGVSEVRVQFRIKLLSLREDIQGLVRTGNFQIGYAQTLADAKLDPNRQMLAMNNFRKNPKPTTGWFRNLVNEYAVQQNQAKMFEDDFLVCQQAPAIDFNLEMPPSPRSTNPEIKGNDAKDTLQKTAAFWDTAAQEWDRLGKTFQKNECLAASSALRYVGDTVM